MPDFDMWGPAQAGSRLAEMDTLKKFMGLAQAKQEVAQAKLQEQQLAEKRQKEEAFARVVAPTKSGTLSEATADVATQLMKLGQYGEAAKLSTQATQMHAHETQSAAAQALESKRLAEQGAIVFEQAANLFRGARSQQDWDAANMMFAQAFPKAENPFASLAFTPENAQLAGRVMLSEKERLQSEDAKERTGILKRNADSLEALRAARSRYLADRIQNDREREKRLAKNGGKAGRETPVGSPSKMDIIAAGQLLESRLEFPLEEEDAKVAAYDVAAEARALMKANPGLSAKEARERAVTAIVASDDLQTVSKLFGKNRMSYTGGGKTAQTAIPVKEKMSFQNGKYYVNSSGVTARFNGTGFEPVEDDTQVDDEE